MKRITTSTALRQMTDKEGFGYSQAVLGIIFGAFILFFGMIFIFLEEVHGVWVVGLALIFVFLGFSSLMPYLRDVEFERDEILLKLGGIVLARYPAEQIKTLVYGTFKPNARWDWEPEIILLSPRSGEEILQIGKTVLDNALDVPAMFPYPRVDTETPAVLADAFVKSKFLDLSLEKGEGIWLEYSPERAERLKTLFPEAEDLMIS